MKLLRTWAILFTVLSTAPYAIGQLASTTKSSNEELVEVVALPEPGTFYVAYLSDAPARLLVSVFDEKGKVLLRQSYRHDVLPNKAFRFTEVPDGSYTFVIQSPKVEYRKTIQNDYFSASRLNVDLVPMENGQKYQLVVVGEEIETLDVTIVDDNEAVLFEESVSLDAGKRAFNLEQVRRGQVHFIISDGERNTIESVNIR